MGSSAPSVPSAEFLAAFRAAGGAARALTFARFMEIALYDPGAGYYRRAGPRIGVGPGTDFFTASSAGPTFGRLIAAACANLLRGGDPRGFEFVEIGAELRGGVLAGVAHPFLSAREVRLGEEPGLGGDCVVFSNELFDAQPFHRLSFRRGAWRENGVALRDGRLVEVELPEMAFALPGLPVSAPEGYRLDAPAAAVQLLRDIARGPWTGLFVACDYGKTWRDLIESTPAGTARAYHRHRLVADLLANPGEQDLTCHVCWDWLAEALIDCGFREPAVEFQESFFVRHAGAFLAAASESGAGLFRPEKLSLMQLLHPSHLGQKFQIMWAWRG